MTYNEMLEEAKKLDIKFSKRPTKEDLVDKLKEHGVVLEAVAVEEKVETKKEEVKDIYAQGTNFPDPYKYKLPDDKEVVKELLREIGIGNIEFDKDSVAFKMHNGATKYQHGTIHIGVIQREYTRGISFVKERNRRSKEKEKTFVG